MGTYFPNELINATYGTTNTHLIALIPLTINHNGAQYDSIEEFINSLLSSGQPNIGLRCKNINGRITMECSDTDQSLISQAKLFIVFKRATPSGVEYYDQTKSFNDGLKAMTADAAIDLGYLNVTNNTKVITGNDTIISFNHLQRSFSFTYSKKLRQKVGSSDLHLDEPEHRSYMVLAVEMYSTVTDTSKQILANVQYDIDLYEVKLQNNLL